MSAAGGWAVDVLPVAPWVYGVQVVEVMEPGVWRVTIPGVPAYARVRRGRKSVGVFVYRMRRDGGDDMVRAAFKDDVASGLREARVLMAMQAVRFACHH